MVLLGGEVNSGISYSEGWNKKELAQLYQEAECPQLIWQKKNSLTVGCSCWSTEDQIRRRGFQGSG